MEAYIGQETQNIPTKGVTFFFSLTTWQMV